MKSVATSKPDYDVIRRVIASIPPGRVSSYGEIANRAGLPGRSRLVGKVLGDSKLETEGKADKAAGKIQNAVGGLKDTLRGDK